MLAAQTIVEVDDEELGDEGVDASPLSMAEESAEAARGGRGAPADTTSIHNGDSAYDALTGRRAAAIAAARLARSCHALGRWCWLQSIDSLLQKLERKRR